MKGKKQIRLKEKKCLRSDDWCFRIVQKIPDAIFLTRADDGVILDVNEAFEKLTGYRQEEILGQTAKQFSFIRDPDLWIQSFQELEGKNEAREIETSIFHRDGRLIYVLMSLRSVDMNGERCCLNIMRDITERKLAEDALRASEQRMKQKLNTILSPEEEVEKPELANIIDARLIQPLMDDFYKLTHIPMSIIDLQGKVLIGVGWQDICMKFHRVHPETCRHCIESDTQLSAGLKAGEFTLYKCKNNMWDAAMPLMMGGQHVGNIFSGQFFFEEESLDYDLFRSQAKRYGFDEQAYITALQAVPRLSRESVNTGISLLIKFAHILSQLSYINVKLARSLAERNALMNSLQKSEEKYRVLIESANDAVFIHKIDEKGKPGPFLEVNEVACRRLGYSKEEFSRMSPFELDAPPSLNHISQTMEKLRTEGHAVFETSHVTKDGQRIPVEISTKVVNLKDGPLLLSIARDITKRKLAEEALRKTQEELIRKEKLSVLGQLAGILGHEIRNPLGVMNNAVYFLKTVMTDADEIMGEYLNIIGQEIDNAQRIISDLLDFSRTKAPQRQSVSLLELVDSSLEKYPHQENVSLRKNISETLPLVQVDPFQMKQVLQNLITNAMQAMPNGGVLTISASPVQEPDSPPEPNVDFVEISVADTGEGISDENMKKLFQPLFTTKPRGIGLGLVACKNLTETNGGRIKVESKLGTGTIFTVMLPVKPKS